MCYAVYLSTDCPEDLAVHNTELVRFERLGVPSEDPCAALLAFGNRWYVGSKSGCSCTFRHLASIELGFGEPEDWCKEEQDELDATRELYSVIASLLASGCSVDLLDRWEGAQPSDIRTLDVSLDDVTREAFRLFENHRFTLRQKEIQQEK